MPAKDEFDPSAPQKEAAVFYGLFLRGHSPERMRQDIDVPPRLLSKWQKSPVYESPLREDLERLYRYRKQVLAIFEALVSSERMRARLQ